MKTIVEAPPGAQDKPAGLTAVKPAIKKTKNKETAPIVVEAASEPENADHQANMIQERKVSAPHSDVNDNPDVEEAEVEEPSGLTPLSDEDREERDCLVVVAREGFDKAWLGSHALFELRRRQLFRETHKTFEQFCKDELDLSEARVSQLISFATEVERLKDLVAPDLVPSNERAVREIRRAKPVNRVRILERAAELSTTGKPNSTNIADARREIEGDPKEKAKADVVKPEAALKAALVFQKYLGECDVKDLTGHQLDELRTAAGGIVMEVEKLATKAA